MTCASSLETSMHLEEKYVAFHISIESGWNGTDRTLKKILVWLNTLKFLSVKLWNNAKNSAIFVLEIHVWYIVTLAKSSEKDTM